MQSLIIIEEFYEIKWIDNSLTDTNLQMKIIYLLVLKEIKKYFEWFDFVWHTIVHLISNCITNDVSKIEKNKLLKSFILKNEE